ncbi:MAG: DUF488 family protein [Sulfolobales archaeon]
MVARTIFTLGYDALELEYLKSIVLSRGVEVVVDVRRWGKSIRFPRYSSTNLEREFANIGVSYEWMPSLGGYRRFGVDVVDIGIGRCFKSEGFRAYVTYLLTSEEARMSLERLLELGLKYKIVLLCREKQPYRCHRKILSDWLVYKGFRVVHLIPPKEIDHRFTKCARVINGRLTYL